LRKLAENKTFQRFEKMTGTMVEIGGLMSAGGIIKKVGVKFFIQGAAKTGAEVIEQTAVHGNSLLSTKPTWGYKLFSQDGTFLKNGITNKVIPQSRYTKAFMSDKYMVPVQQFPNRLGAYQWEFGQNQILRGRLNLNMH
jgi:hypothetical protein